MKKRQLLSAVIGFGALSLLIVLPARDAGAQVVFQAAGPDAASIQGAVDGFRTALGALNTTLPAVASGRREINWDGGNPTVDVTTTPVTPFDVFLNARGARFTTPGVGLTQAPTQGGPQGGLAVLFNQPSYGTIFAAFSPQRLFSPVGSRITDGFFFVPGTAGGVEAVSTGFGAVFSDVDEPNGEKGAGRHSTKIEYFDADGRKIYTGFVPASPGDATFSFFGVVFDTPIVRRVRITTGDANPGVDDAVKDIVMMDDFIYGEPQPIP